MAIKPVTHRIEQHSNVNRIDTPVASDVLEYTDPLWAPEPGGGGGAHDILSATHPDTFAADVEADGDVLTWIAASTRWEARPAAGGGAPVGASYIVIALDGTLTAERRLQVEAAVLSLTDGGANGDVTIGIAAGGVVTAKIGDNQVTLGKIADIATARLLGRVTAGSGDPEELTGTQATTLLDAFTSALKGLAPASGGGTTNFLRADGTWAAPSGGSGAPSDAQYVVLALNGTLTDERVLTEGDGLQITDGGAGGNVTLLTQTRLGITVGGGANTFTNLGAGPTVFTNTTGKDYGASDLTDTDEVRCTTRVATAGVTGDLKVQYSTDGATWNDLTTLIDLSSTGVKASTWQAVPAGAKGLVLLRAVAVGGNGTEDPIVWGCRAEFR
jgi:hypothetical protein